MRKLHKIDVMALRVLAVMAAAVVGYGALIATAAEVNEKAENMVGADFVRQIVRNCQVEREGKIPVVGDVPMIGSFVDGGLDSMTGGPKRRNNRENRCIDERLEARRSENEREAEEATRLLSQNCAIDWFRCGNDENERRCEALWGVEGTCPND